MGLRRTLPFLVLVVAVAAVPAAADVPMENNAYIGSEACYDCHDTGLDTVATIPLFEG